MFAPVQSRDGDVANHELLAGVSRRGRRPSRSGAAVALLLAVSSPAQAQPGDWQPPRPSVSVPLPPGSASDPEESALDAAPAGAEAYPPARNSQPTGAPEEMRAARGYAPEAPPATARALLWAPRIVLFPVFVVTQYALRWPLTHTARYAEHHYWPQQVVDFFTFGPNNEASLWPYFYFDLGFRARAGLYFSWDRAFVPANSLRLRATTGGTDSFQLGAKDGYALTSDAHINLTADISRRPDLAFWGLGPESNDGPFRYGSSALHVAAAVQLSGWRSSALGMGVELQRRRFDTGASSLGDASLDQGLVGGRLAALPPGTDGYTTVSPMVRAALDSRRPRHEDGRVTEDSVSPPGTGLRLAAHAGYSLDLERPRAADTARSWLRYGGLAAAYLDLTGQQRTLGLSVKGELVHALAGGPQVPFSEQPALGGGQPMPGLRGRRLVGASAVAARLQYRWPIWVSLDGTADAALGNVFGPELAGFDVGLLRASFALGMATNAARDASLEFLIGAGTGTLRSGAELEEMRLAVGTTISF
jgi:hypothetical protein